MMISIDKFRDADDDDALSDETILNVFRKKDEKVLKTAEIAEELPITQNWTSKRLNKLETKERVHSKSAGPGRVWWLDENEPTNYIPEGIGDLVFYATEARQAARNVWIMCIGMFIVGGLLLIPILLLDIFPPLRAIPFRTQDFAFGAFVAALGGTLFLMGGCYPEADIHRNIETIHAVVGASEAGADWR